MFKNIKINEIDSGFAKTISQLLSNSDKNYTKYFIPFSFDVATIREILSTINKDKFFGILVDNDLVGFYMLRGFDAGYETPSYGVWISERFAGYGLSKLTLQHAITYCKINSIKKLMLKVHPENIMAKNIYESFGFIQKGIDDKNNNLIYYKNLVK